MVFPQDVTDVLAEKALDALAKLLHAIDVALEYSPSSVLGVRRSRGKLLDSLFDLEVPGDIRHQVLNDREGLHGLDRDGLFQGELFKRVMHSSRGDPLIPPNRIRTCQPCNSSGPPSHWPAQPGSCARRQAQPCPRKPRSCSRETHLSLRCPAKSETLLSACLLSSLPCVDDLLQFVRDGRDRLARDLEATVRVPANCDVQVPESLVLIWEVQAGMSAPAFLALQGSPGNRFRIGQEIPQVQSRVPAWVVLSISVHGYAAGARAQAADAFQGVPRSRSLRTIPTWSCIIF